MIESVIWALVVLVIAGLAFAYGYLDLRRRDQRRDIDTLRTEMQAEMAKLTKDVGDLKLQVFRTRG